MPCVKASGARQPWLRLCNGAVYLVLYANAVYVLHAFQEKSKKVNFACSACRRNSCRIGNLACVGINQSGHEKARQLIPPGAISLIPTKNGKAPVPGGVRGFPERAKPTATGLPALLTDGRDDPYTVR